MANIYDYERPRYGRDYDRNERDYNRSERDYNRYENEPYYRSSSGSYSEPSFRGFGYGNSYSDPYYRNSGYGSYYNEPYYRSSNYSGSSSEPYYRSSGYGSYSNEPYRSRYSNEYGNEPYRGRYYGGSSEPYGSYDYGRYQYGNRYDDQYNRDPYNRNDDRGFFERAGDEIRSWFGDEEAERRRRMDAGRRENHSGRGPSSYQRSDERIKEDVNDRLTDDSFLDATNIEVNVNDRLVTLTGNVDSRDDKRRAEYLAEMVSGVTDVSNQLRVNRTGQTQYGSTETASTTGTGARAKSART